MMNSFLPVKTLEKSFCWVKCLNFFSLIMSVLQINIVFFEKKVAKGIAGMEKCRTFALQMRAVVFVSSQLFSL